MYDNYTQLTIEGLTRGVTLHNAYILILKEKGGTRIYPILMNKEAHQNIRAVLNHQEEFPSTQLMNRLARLIGMETAGIRLMPPTLGETNALIDFVLDGKLHSLSVSASDAIISALENDTNIWVDTQIFERYTSYGNEVTDMAMPLSAMSNPLLEEALEAAVNEDNFELAAALHKELKKRQEMKEEQSENPEEATDNKTR